MSAAAWPTVSAAGRGTPELGDIFRRYADRYAASHVLRPVQHKVMRDLGQCRTAALGGHLEECDRCGRRRAVYHSCRNRHCPKCQALSQADWLEARSQDLLPIEYFHIVFTLPHELCPLALYRPRVVYNLLFRAATDTLATFARDPRYFSAKSGGTLGVTAILHTWGQNLSLHPHLHCVVTGGALDAGADAFVTPRHKGFLFPVKALSRVFRAKFIEGLSQAFERGELGEDTATPALCKALRNLDWVVYAKPPFAGPQSVLAYLSAYTHRIAISNHRILRVEGRRVSFRYRDYAEGSKNKVMNLDLDEFIRRFLMHVLPKRFVRIRHYGLLANRSRKKKVARCRELLSANEPAPIVKQTPAEKLLRLTGADILQCPNCHLGRLKVIAGILRTDRYVAGPIRVVEVCDSS